MELNIKRIKKENLKSKQMKLKIVIKILRKKMKSLNAQLLIAPNISIPNVYKNMILKSYSNILMPTHCISDVHCITAMHVV